MPEKMFNHKYNLVTERQGERFTFNIIESDTRDKLNWEPKYKLFDGLKITYQWIKEDINKKHNQ